MLRATYRQFSSLTSPLPWTACKILPNGSVETFRKDAFVPSVPTMPPKGNFHDFPAISRWFSLSKEEPNTAALQHDYLNQFGDATVAQEYSFSPESLREASTIGSLFIRQELPLSNFLQWVKNFNNNSTFRIYLAQTSISALPSKMRYDLPIPDIVSKVGRGDVYDASIWIGIAPTYTPLHRDPNPNIIVQLAGHKTVRLLPPDAGLNVFAMVQDSLGKMGSATFRGEEMMMGEEGRLLDDLVWDHKTQCDKLFSSGVEAHLAQGDGLFIPKGWWHSVKGLGTGITASVRPSQVLIISRPRGNIPSNINV